MLSELLVNFARILLEIINELGYFGIFIGMTIESSFFPFPSEIILIPAGALVAQGKMNILAVFAAGLLGSLLGAWINYFIALYLGRKTIDLFITRYGKFLFIKKRHLEKSDGYFKKHGEITTFVGRLIVGVRQLISLPAGFSKMNFFRFSLFTAIGAGIWTIILIYVGYLFGANSELIKENMNLVTFGLILFCLIIILIYLLLKKYWRMNGKR